MIDNGNSERGTKARAPPTTQMIIIKNGQLG